MDMEGQLGNAAGHASDAGCTANGAFTERCTKWPKKPFASYTVVATIPANEAFRPLAEGGCTLVR